MEISVYLKCNVEGSCKVVFVDYDLLFSAFDSLKAKKLAEAEQETY